jgi:hypothetical protein
MGVAEPLTRQVAAAPEPAPSLASILFIAYFVTAFAIAVWALARAGRSLPSLRALLTSTFKALKRRPTPSRLLDSVSASMAMP